MGVALPLTATGIFGLIIGLTSSASLAADSVADFYNGKTVSIVSRSSPGGGYDLQARQLARHIGKHIPGNPKVIVQNMPAAGGREMANWLAVKAARDGTIIGQPSNSASFLQAVKDAGVRYDVRKFIWVGSVAPQVGAYAFWHTTGVGKFEDISKGKQFTAAAQVPGTISDIFPKLMNAFLGTDLKIIHGYDDSGAANIAMERGEIDSRFAYLASFKTQTGEWLKNGDIKLVLQTSPRSKELPNVPSIEELVTKEFDKQVVNLAISNLSVGLPYTLPPEVPEDRVKAIRNAFMATMTDPDFVEELTKTGDIIDPLSGEELERLANRTVDVPDSVVARTLEMMNQN
jgi:tripartite-type tricarboxylate transporter receptor subunit TctC